MVENRLVPWFCGLLLSWLCLPLATFAEEIINHPGKIPLIYYGEFSREPPLPPLQKVKVDSKYFYVYPGVVVPSVQSVFLLEHTDIFPGEAVLDIGTGTGVQAIFAAEKASRVVATDLGAESVASTRFNVRGHRLQDKIDVRQGDLFGPIRKDERFDVIIMNIDYPVDDPDSPLWEVHERFFREVGKYLTPGGRIYYQSGLIGNVARVAEMLRKNQLITMEMTLVTNLVHQRQPIVYLIQREADARKSVAGKGNIKQ